MLSVTNMQRIFVALALGFTCHSAAALPSREDAFAESRTSSAPLAGAADPEAVTCVAYWPEARYGAIGYNHFVHLVSSCPAAAVCKVSTNVNPQSVDVAVKPGEHVEVLTFRGSPAREFTPRVSCKFRS